MSTLEVAFGYICLSSASLGDHLTNVSPRQLPPSRKKSPHKRPLEANWNWQLIVGIQLYKWLRFTPVRYNRDDLVGVIMKTDGLRGFQLSTGCDEAKCFLWLAPLLLDKLWICTSNERESLYEYKDGEYILAPKYH